MSKKNYFPIFWTSYIIFYEKISKNYLQLLFSIDWNNFKSFSRKTSLEILKEGGNSNVLIKLISFSKKTSLKIL